MKLIDHSMFKYKIYMNACILWIKVLYLLIFVFVNGSNLFTQSKTNCRTTQFVLFEKDLFSLATKEEEIRTV